MWFSKSTLVIFTHSIGFCLPPHGISVPIRSDLSMKSQCIDQVVLEKAKNSCNR